MKYNFYYDSMPITRTQFESVVPSDWEDNLENEEYSWGYYKAVKK